LCGLVTIRWFKDERDDLFQRLSFLPVSLNQVSGVFPKISTKIEISILKKLAIYGGHFEDWLSRGVIPHKLFYKITGVGSWFTIIARPPKFLRGRRES
jgi:hypothetical protein